MTIFDAFTGWFAPILVHSQAGLYLVGYLRLGPHGTHYFLIIFYTLMAIQGGAIGAAFTLKFYALAPPNHQRSIHLLCILYIISIYSTIPICVTFLYLAYDRQMEEYFWETVSCR
ncbi:unnamed protein product, partial [Mesorhabditis belari]|uniref:Uncharacterized protein n=1 Tax=Mesorhabditis belari TaxID=2138241 RepID=A0AAF3F5U2_9BILA